MSISMSNMNMNKVSATHAVQLDMDPGITYPLPSVPRDPQDLNKNAAIVWNSVIGEPESVRSPDWVWKIATLGYVQCSIIIFFVAKLQVFNIVQGWTYKILTVITAPIIALIIGFHFALLIFLQIWCFRPILKFLHIIFAMIRTLGEIVLNGICGPAFETIGLCMSNVKIRHQRVYDAKDEPQFPFII